jgi:hypothetical protein
MANLQAGNIHESTEGQPLGAGSLLPLCVHACNPAVSCFLKLGDSSSSRSSGQLLLNVDPPHCYCIVDAKYSVLAAVHARVQLLSGFACLARAEAHPQAHAHTDAYGCCSCVQVGECEMVQAFDVAVLGAEVSHWQLTECCPRVQLHAVTAGAGAVGFSASASIHAITQHRHASYSAVVEVPVFYI